MQEEQAKTEDKEEKISGPLVARLVKETMPAGWRLRVGRGYNPYLQLYDSKRGYRISRVSFKMSVNAKPWRMKTNAELAAEVDKFLARYHEEEARRSMERAELTRKSIDLANQRRKLMDGISTLHNVDEVRIGLMNGLDLVIKANVEATGFEVDVSGSYPQSFSADEIRGLMKRLGFP